MFVISLILINWLSLTRSTIFWSMNESNFLFLPDPGLLSKLQISFSFLFRKYRFDFEAKSINFSLSILYIEYPLSIKVFSNCCLVVSWSDIFCFNSSLIIIISSSDSTDQNSSSFSYFEDNLDSEVKELFFLSYLSSSSSSLSLLSRESSVTIVLFNSFLWVVYLCAFSLSIFVPWLV